MAIFRSRRARVSRQIQSAVGALLSVVLLLFAISHLETYAETGLTSVLLFSLAEIVIAILFMLRVPFRRHRDADDLFASEDIAGWEPAGAVRDLPEKYSRC